MFRLLARGINCSRRRFTLCVRCFLICLLLKVTKGMPKSGRPRVQPLFLALTKLLLHDVFHASLLVHARHRHVGINLRCRTRFHREGYLMKIFKQGVAFEIVVQQHASQVGMAGKLNPKHVVYFALQPVGGGPDRYDAVDFRLLMVYAYLNLQQLTACYRA